MDTNPTVCSRIPHFSIAGVNKGGSWFVTATFDKQGTGTSYHMLPYVPERFPPLSELAQSWSFERVLSEYSASKSDERKRTLIAELARRGMSNDQFTIFLSKVALCFGGKCPNDGMREVFFGFEQADKKDSLPRYFDVGVAFFEQIDPRAQSEISVWLWEAASTCSPGCEGPSIQFVKSGKYVESARSFLKKCAVTEEGRKAAEQ